MKRKCREIRTAKHGKVAIYIDSLNSKEILDYIGQDDRHKEKFLTIVKIIMEGLVNSHLYKREIVGKIRDIWAMRMLVGQENDRIYCKEVPGNPCKMVIMGILSLHKDTDELSPRQIHEIKTLSSYEYEIENWPRT